MGGIIDNMPYVTGLVHKLVRTVYFHDSDIFLTEKRAPLIYDVNWCECVQLYGLGNWFQ